jgi:hypothetical protein
MDWNKINLFAFFPPFLSIYLLFISSLGKGYLSGQIQRAVDRKMLTGHEVFVYNLASGWASQLGFINAMFASFFSTISVWSASRSFGGVVLTLALLLLMFAPMLWYLFSHEPDQIESDKSGKNSIHSRLRVQSSSAARPSAKFIYQRYPVSFSCCSVRSGGCGPRWCRRPGAFASPASPSSRNRCAHL